MKEPEPEPEPEPPARPLPTNVHDRLADSSTFTGAHRQRFDPTTGKGRGLAGRDPAVKGAGTHSIRGDGSAAGVVVHDVSQLYRPDVRGKVTRNLQSLVVNVLVCCSGTAAACLW